MIKVGQFNSLKVLRLVEIGAYLDNGEEGILIPKRFLPRDVQQGELLDVFIYHDSEGRIIATTQKPLAMAGEVARLRVVSVTLQGAFLDWGLMKDLFVPKSKQLTGMRVGGEYLVMVYIDEQTGRIAATEKIDPFLQNDLLSVKELDPVDIVLYRRSDIGYVVIINNQHTGVLHFNEIYREVREGDKFKGYVKRIYPDNKIDVVLGTSGYKRVEEETDKIIRLLKENEGYLPYHDKSEPEEIYEFFGMSKKTFKMATGNLYKKKLIVFTQTGIKLADG